MIPETGVNNRVFSAFLQDRSEVWTATVYSGSPKSIDHLDRATFSSARHIERSMRISRTARPMTQSRT